MSEQLTVLFANEAYYTAFQSGNYDMMETAWARSVPISCIHPGANNLLGWDSVMESWKSILGNGDLPNLEVVNPVANVYGDIAVVICYEVFGEVTLVATNIFVKEKNNWKIVHHQAGGSPKPPEEEQGYEKSTTLQ
jgi:hypothetical protein